MPCLFRHVCSTVLTRRRAGAEDAKESCSSEKCSRREPFTIRPTKLPKSRSWSKASGGRRFGGPAPAPGAEEDDEGEDG
eukprot:CAMPEP_0177183728 /NCGR_PEP_ID=MMETSP0367-20130122/17170_1 /TAXON_ID=447022 ORGANISM="Scrippsiella hangoei-like, Strain SHHI-4" /NCGR_SAMPLE_ID=MMETSP0367 /ASSEMBLY_ACC=CAM_ASM_000362 /LENGTH=78 /DNA_ID=CAMNT_0018630779 /DNA_START=275 /DNA_END=511 /DNA_ORIENTATION=-